MAAKLSHFNSCLQIPETNGTVDLRSHGMATVREPGRRGETDGTARDFAQLSAVADSPGPECHVETGRQQLLAGGRKGYGVDRTLVPLENP